MPGKYDKIMESSRMALKKLFAAKGKLQGNFYYISGTPTEDELPEAVLLATLAAKDKRGMRAVTMGKQFRKVFEGSKFARGKIVFQDKRFTLLMSKGKARPAEIKCSLRDVVSTQKGVTFLKRANVVMEGKKGEVEVAPDDDAKLTAEDKLAIEEEEKQAAASLSDDELKALIDEQGDLQTLNKTLQTFFDNDQDDEKIEEQYQKDLQDILQQLDQLEQKPALRLEQRLEAHTKLAQLVAVGLGELPEVDEALPPELRVTLQNAMTITQQNTGALLQQVSRVVNFYQEKNQPEELKKPLEDCLNFVDANNDEEVERLLFEELIPLMEHLHKNEPSYRSETEGQRKIREIDEALNAPDPDMLHLAGRLREAYNHANAELGQLISNILSDSDVNQDPQFSDFSGRVQGLRSVLPYLSATIDNAITEIGEQDQDVEQARLNAFKLLDAYRNQLDQAKDQLEPLEGQDNPFGQFEIYTPLANAIAPLHTYLSK